MSDWKKVKIGDVCKIIKGATGIASAEPGEYPLVVTAEERKTCSTYQFDCEAVCIPLVSSSGHGKKSLKNVHYQSGKFALGTILCAVIPNDSNELDARFLRQYLQFYKDTILVPLMKGAANVSLSMKDIATVEFPLPPIEKQRELSELFVSLQEKERILQVEYTKQFEYTKQLRQNILQDAIEGKLTEEWRKSNPVVKGNPDFDAEALFEKIQEEKCHTDSELPLETSLQIRNSKKKKVFEPISENEQPFEISEGWKWVRLGEVSESCLGKMLDSTKNQGTKRKYLRNINVRWFSFDLSDLLEMKIKDIELARCSAQKGDLLICEGGYPGRSAIWNENYEICFQKAIHRVRFFYMSEMSRIFNLYLFLLSENKQIEMYLTGEAIRHLTGVKLKQIPIPLPPLAEQKEIVRVVESQLAKVDQLEKQIAERETMTKQMLQSIMKDAFKEE